MPSSLPAAHPHRSHLLALGLAVLVVHLVLLTQGPAWWSLSPSPQNSPLRFTARQINTEQPPAPPSAKPAGATPPKPNTPTSPEPRQTSQPSQRASTPSALANPSAPSHPSASALSPNHPPDPLPLHSALPNPAAPVALPERAASAVDLPPFQRRNGEGQLEPSPAQAPPSATLSYAVNGLTKGIHYFAHAVLDWKNTSGRYQATLEVGAFWLGSRTQTSVGAIGPEGLMPERFSDKSRSELAAHFQRDKGIISFSANTPDIPLIKGAQDRLSVVLQLSALLAADPARFPLGTMLSVQTVTQREAEVWQFKVVDEETLELPFGKVASIKLQRNPRRDFDQRIELWFAPALGYLPVRLRITNANGDAVDQTLRSLDHHAP